MVAVWLFAAACGSTSPTAQLTSITVTGNPTLNGIGQTAQLSAMAKFSDGTTQDVTSKATWQTGNAAFVSVSSTGVATGTGFGQTSISATDQSVSGSLTVATVLTNLTGTWKGTGTDSSGSTQFTSVLTQAATAVSGSSTFTSGGATGNGSFTGTVNPAGTNFTFAVAVSASVGSQTCTINLSGIGQLNGNVLTGTYSGTNSCAGNIANGQFALTKQ
jgi:trimeric autotransporter adhesin